MSAVEPFTPRVSDAERSRRWRMVLGGAPDDAGAPSQGFTAIPLHGDDTRIDAALAAVYDTAPTRRGRSGRAGGLGSSAPGVVRWLGDIRRYFPSTVVQVMQRDAIDRLRLRQLLLEPEMLQAVEPDLHLATLLVELNHLLPDATRASARRVVSQVVAAIQQRLEARTRQAVAGALARSLRIRRPRHADIDWARTLHANLRHCQPQLGTVVPEKLVGFMAKARTQPCVVPTLDAAGNRKRQHSVVFGVESLKDVNVPIAAMAAEASGGFDLDNSTGGLGANDPALAKLVADYKAANTHTETLVFEVDPLWYKRYAKLHGSRKDCQFFDDGKTIAWTGEVITGSMVLAVEYSPTFSAIGKTQVLLETLLLMDSVYPELAAHYWVANGGRRQRKLVDAHLDMAFGEVPKVWLRARMSWATQPPICTAGPAMPGRGLPSAVWL